MCTAQANFRRTSALGQKRSFIFDQPISALRQMRTWRAAVLCPARCWSLTQPSPPVAQTMSLRYYSNRTARWGSWGQDYPEIKENSPTARNIIAGESDAFVLAASRISCRDFCRTEHASGVAGRGGSNGLRSNQSRLRERRICQRRNKRGYWAASGLHRSDHTRIETAEEGEQTASAS